MNDKVTMPDHDLSDVTDAALIAEIREGRYESDAIDDFYEEVGNDAIAELEEEHVVIDLGTLEDLNDVWRAPEQFPAEVRRWLQQTTGRV